MLDPIVTTLDVSCGQKEAFSIFVNDMGRWWPLDKRAMSLYSGTKPKELRVEAAAGGTIVEIGEDGTEYLWGTFRDFNPYDSVSMDFHIGLPAENASLVTVTFTRLDEATTRVVLTHTRWEAFGDLAAQMHGGYGSSWTMILERFGAACNG